MCRSPDFTDYSTRGKHPARSADKPEPVLLAIIGLVSAEYPNLADTCLCLPYLRLRPGPPISTPIVSPNLAGLPLYSEAIIISAQVSGLIVGS